MKKKVLFYKILSFILVFLSVFSMGVIYYFDVLPMKYFIPLVIILTVLVFFLIVKMCGRTQGIIKVILSFISIIILILELIGIFYALGTISFFNEIFDTGIRNEVYNIYVLDDSNYEDIADLKNKTIGVYENGNGYDDALQKLSIGYNKLSESSITDCFTQIKDGDIDAFFANESMVDIYLEDVQDAPKVRVLKAIDVSIKVKSTFEKTDITTEPFVLYLSGVDTYGKVYSSSRSDVNLLIAVNPTSGKVLLINTPRDYYVTLASKNKKDKLTHAGVYGVEESANTLSKLYGVDVNYYARVNFTSFVKIVEALDGIEVVVDSPDYSYNGGNYCGSNTICEQKSNRNGILYIKAGKQTLNGEEALAYARCRHQFSDGDNARGRHQMQIIEAMANKATSSAILTKYNDVLKSLSNGLMTNLEQEDITSIVNLQLSQNISWSFESYAVKGTDAYDVVYSSGLKAYVMYPDDASVAEAKIKLNSILNN